MREFIQAPGEERRPAQERPPESAKPFYRYLLGRDLDDSEIYSSYYLIQADIIAINGKINQFVRDTGDASARVLMMVTGSKIAEEFLTGCDPNNDLFVVVPPEK